MVTGSSGYVGGAIARALSPYCRTIVAPVRAGARAPDLPNLQRHELVRDGLADIPDLIARLQPDIVVHCAAYGVKPQDRDAATMFAVNTRATIDICLAATSFAKGMIIAGSSAEYDGRAPAPFSESTPLESRKIYGASKAAATLACLAIAARNAFPCIVLRLFGVYGPDEAPHRLVSSLISRLREGNRVSLSPGDQLRDFIYIDDVASAFLAATAYVLNDADDKVHLVDPINICTGIPVSVKTLCSTMASKLNRSCDLLGFGDLDYRPDDVMAVYGMPDKARELLGWTPAWTLDRALDEILAGRGNA